MNISNAIGPKHISLYVLCNSKVVTSMKPFSSKKFALQIGFSENHFHIKLFLHFMEFKANYFDFTNIRIKKLDGDGISENE